MHERNNLSFGKRYHGTKIKKSRTVGDYSEVKRTKSTSVGDDRRICPNFEGKGQ